MTNRARPKILVVDDERANISLLANILIDEYKTIIALNGEEALKRATVDSPPDLILLDIMMPGMDGYEVCRRLKDDERTRDIPVIFVTAMGDEEDETRGLALGAVDYLTKPIRPPIVKARVKNHLTLQFARRQLEEQNRELIEAARLREDVERITRHDLKNPLNAVIGYPQVLLEATELSETQQNYLKKIEDAGLKMLDMINRSLDLFKMERGMYVFNPSAVDLVPIIRNIMAEMQRRIQRKQVSVNCVLNAIPFVNDSACHVMGEELLCYSLLANLMRNALEASPREAYITIALETHEQYVSICTHNSGAVPETIRETFFEKYVTAGKSDGTGLGTYSAKLIATTQGGRIQMTTSEAEGTTVEVRLPAA